MPKEKVIFNWSGGKDSALCLYKLLQANQNEVVCLLTSVNAEYQRISMHGVRVELLEAQAQSIGLPLQQVLIPEMPTMEVYENVMKETLTELIKQGATTSVFGDIFLEDLRKYREDKLVELNLKGLFPLWKIPTHELIREFLALGFKTITTCVNEKYLDKSFVGRIIDEDFLNALPSNVDPCGENGEFHTFVFDGPLFKKPIPFEIGEIVHRTYTPAKQQDNSSYDCNTEDTETPYDNGFWYCDLIGLS
ncbi:MAG: diphthine--ammonia ligase [Bacteroidota bacterium]